MQTPSMFTYVLSYGTGRYRPTLKLNFSFVLAKKTLGGKRDCSQQINQFRGRVIQFDTATPPYARVLLTTHLPE